MDLILSENIYHIMYFELMGGYVEILHIQRNYFTKSDHKCILRMGLGTLHET